MLSLKPVALSVDQDPIIPWLGIAAEGVDECKIVSCAKKLQIIEDGKLGRRGVVDAAAQMVELVVEQMKVWASQEALRRNTSLPAEAFNFHASSTLPGEPKRIVERMQHGKRQVDANKGSARGRQPLAEAAHHRLQIVADQGGAGQPVGDLVHQYLGNVGWC